MPEQHIPLIRLNKQNHLWLSFGIHASKGLKLGAEITAGAALLAGAVWIASNDHGQNVITSPPPVPHESPSGVFQPGTHTLEVPDSDEITYGHTVFSQLRNKKDERTPKWQVDGQYPFVVITDGVRIKNPDVHGSTCTLENAGISPSPTDPPVMTCTPGTAKEKSLFIHGGAKHPPVKLLTRVTRTSAPQRPAPHQYRRV